MWIRASLYRGTGLAILFCLLIPAAFSQTLVGKVVKIQDGDTLTLLVDRAQSRLRK